MKTKLKSILLAVPLALMALSVVPVTQTGCKTVNGTNSFDVTAAATAIKAVLGSVVVFVENSDPSTIPDFQTASAGLRVLISNNSTNVADLSATLQGLGKNDLTKLAIAEAVSLYSLYLGQAVANGIDANATAKALLQAVKDALDMGIQKQAKRVQSKRAPVK